MNWNEIKPNLIRRHFLALNKPDRDEWLTHREACNHSLYYFIKECGGYMAQSGGDIIEAIHKPVLDFWQDKTIKRKAVFMPRSWKKTTCLTQWGNVWEYLQDNEVRILIPSEKEEKATEWLILMENQILRNERLRWLYPELSVVDRAYTKRNPFSSKSCVMPREHLYSDPTFKVIGIRGGAQGGHYDIINPDDLVGEKGMESALVLEDAVRWFDDVGGLCITKDKADPSGSIIRIVGTFWSPGDFGCYVQERYPEYQWRIVPCLKDESLVDSEGIKWVQNPLSAAGESNWPEMFPTADYKEMMANPEQQRTFWAQYMNNPKSDTGMTKLDVRWYKYYHLDVIKDKTFVVCEDDGETFDLSEIPKEGMIDPGGFSETKLLKTGARNAVLIGGQPLNSVKKFVFHTWAGRPKETDEFAKQVFDPQKKWKVQTWRIETIGAQEYIKRDLKERAVKQKININIVSMPKNNKKDEKDDDIQAVGAVMQNGEIYILNSMYELKAETQNYPRGLTKDLIDMLGKINKYSWSRGKRQDLMDRNQITWSDYRDMNPTTGY